MALIRNARVWWMILPWCLLLLPEAGASGRAALAPSWVSSLDNQNDEAPMFFEFPESMDNMVGCFDFVTADNQSCTSAVSEIALLEELVLPPEAMVNHHDDYAYDSADQGCSGSVPPPSAMMDREADAEAGSGGGVAPAAAQSVTSSPDNHKYSLSGVMDIEGSESMNDLSCIDFAETMDNLSCIDFTIDDELFDLWS
uniref:Uncharacterized protein n=1 Tax=Oryza punctata TaxID=4537 RepID=A0A0E0LCX0_ORYPU